MSENSLTLVLQKKTRKILTPGKGKQKTEKFTPFGGNYFTNRAFNALSLGKVINETLGKRSSTYNGYQWDEIVSSMLDVYLCGGNCVEDVNRKECHLRETPDTRIPTSHTVGRAIKELACENTSYESPSGKKYEFNANSKLNELLIKLNMRMGLFREGQTINVDFDHVFIKAEKDDAKYSYKQAFGYFPGVVSINGVIAYIENRDGNTPVKFHQADTLERAFSLLRSNGLHVGSFRADCGSYSEDIIRTVDGNCRLFYIRASHSSTMYSNIQDIKEWRPVEIDSQKTKVASFMSTHFMEDSHYRIVVQRTEVKEDTLDLFGKRYLWLIEAIRCSCQFIHDIVLCKKQIVCVSLNRPIAMAPHCRQLILPKRFSMDLTVNQITSWRFITILTASASTSINIYSISKIFYMQINN